MNYMEHFTGPLSVLAAGAAGSTLRVVLLPPASRRLMVVHIVLGALMSVFVAPGVVEYWLSGKGVDVQRLVAFAIGAAGPILAEIAIRTIERRGDRVADRLVDRVAGTEDKK